MIAAINGACIGGATNMVTFADMRYCTNDSYFQVKEAALGKVHIFWEGHKIGQIVPKRGGWALKSQKMMT